MLKWPCTKCSCLFTWHDLFFPPGKSMIFYTKRKQKKLSQWPDLLITSWLAFNLIKTFEEKKNGVAICKGTLLMQTTYNRLGVWKTNLRKKPFTLTFLSKCSSDHVQNVHVYSHGMIFFVASVASPISFNFSFGFPKYSGSESNSRMTTKNLWGPIRFQIFLS